MKIPLTVADHLRRAEVVYGDRVAIVDEPDQVAPALPDLTYARTAELARAMAAGLDAMGLDIGARVAMVSHNAARLLVFLFGTSAFGRVGVPINFRLNAEEVQYIVDRGSGLMGMLQQCIEHAQVFRHRLTLHPKSDQEDSSFDRIRITRKDAAHTVPCLLPGQILAQLGSGRDFLNILTHGHEMVTAWRCDKR